MAMRVTLTTRGNTAFLMDYRYLHNCSILIQRMRTLMDFWVMIDRKTANSLDLHQCPFDIAEAGASAFAKDTNGQEGDQGGLEHQVLPLLVKVWRGALVLADFILSKPLMFKGATVVELGAGSGLTSIIMATLAKRVYCTDVGEDLLGMCQRNITLNEHMIERAGGDVKVRLLDWLRSDLCTDPDVEFSWTEEEIADIHDNASVILAADVCYDDELTDGFFRTLYRLCSNFAHACNIFISIEKRFNFTLRQMDVSCDAYNHFQHCLSQLEDLEDGQLSYTVEQLPCTFPQGLQYERIDHLELWKVTAKRVPFDQAQSNSEQATS